IPPQQRSFLAGLHDCSGPFMSRDEIKCLRPEAGEIPGDDVRVGSANISSIYFTKYLITARNGHGNLFYRKITDSLQYKGIHCFWYMHIVTIICSPYQWPHHGEVSPTHPSF